MKFAIFSDVQHHCYKAHANMIRKTRLQASFDVSDVIYNYANENGIKHVLFPGDWFDSQKVLHSEVVNANTSYVAGLRQRFPHIFTYPISGNHDYASKNLIHKPAITALQHLSDVNENFILMDGKSMRISGSNVVLHGIPYYEYKEHFRTRLEEMAGRVAKINAKFSGERLYHILMIHQTPSGTAGNIPMDTDPNDPLYAVFDMIFCGHIHRPVRITPKFIQVGNPNHRDASDIDNEKGFWVLDTDLNQVDFVSLKGFYPEFRVVRLKRGERLEPDGENFLLPLYDNEDYKDILSATDKEAGYNDDDFSPELPPDRLIRNYWAREGKGDEALLQEGLNCLA